MNLKERWRSALLEAGAVAVGFARAERVPREVWTRFEAWRSSGRAGELGYMGNYPELRFDPRGLLEGARTVISVAWPYLPDTLRDDSLPFIARYAYCADYHKSIRRILKPLLRSWNTVSRVCVDSAPVLERWWAVRSGVGFIGRNGCLIVPGYGSWVFLTEILVTEMLEPDEPCTLHCDGCGVCIRACPTGALGPDGLTDCRKCLSALTVETPGKAPRTGRVHLAGCDRCQEVCPHNLGARPTQLPAFAAVPAILTLSGEELLTHTEETFRADYAGTSLTRMGLEGLLANLSCQS